MAFGIGIVFAATCGAGQVAKGMEPHAFLGTSHAQQKVYLVDQDGKQVWEYPVANPQDVWLLPSGNILTTWLHGVKEVAPDKRVVWEYTVKAPNEVPNCQPLPDGSVMIGVVGECRLIEVDRFGQIRHEVRLETTEKKPHAQFRMCRKTAEGTYLVPFTSEGAVREYDRDGKCVRRFPMLGSPVGVERLPNGNTLITGGGCVTEYDAKDGIVWRLDLAKDLPDVHLGIPAGVRRLPNGNTLFCNWGSHTQGSKRGVSVLEVTPDKRVVWEVSAERYEKVAQCHLVESSLDAFAAGAKGPPATERPERLLPTGQRQPAQASGEATQAWPQSVLIAHAGYERLLAGEAGLPQTENPGFAGAFYARKSRVTVAGCPALDQTPLTVRLRVKCASANQFNIFVAHEPKHSASHWELYSFLGDGTIALYMPGNRPDVIRSKACVTDGKWHDVAAVLTSDRVSLFVDGKTVGEGPVTRTFGRAKGETRLGIGCLVEGGLACDGWLDDLSISAEALVVAQSHRVPQQAGDATVMLCAFDVDPSRPAGEFAVLGKLAGTINVGSHAEDFVDELLPRGGREPTVKPGEKPPKNVPAVACTSEQLAEAVARLGLKAVRAEDIRPGVLALWGEQAMELQNQIDGKMPLPRGAAGQVYDAQALIQAGEKTPYEVVVRRTGALLDALQKRSSSAGTVPRTVRGRHGEASLPERLDDLKQDLARLKAYSASRSNDVFAACAVRRAAMLANPDLAAYDKLAFLARATYAGCRLTNMGNSDRTGGHFNTQCFGFNTIHGGGVFALEGWRSKSPSVRNLVEGRVVTNGRLKGKTLDTGSFYTPEVSYDGKTLYFAHCGSTEHRWVWSDATTWKLFKLDLESGAVTQLTEGPWNDFDPVELPSGRLAFISERRGGFIRCFGEGARMRVPTFVLHSMSAGGGDIYPISYFETSEWQPSVDNSGMLVYTRWDYTDRENCLGSLFWTCYPDGRDPRAPHGNYPQPWHTFADNTHGDHRFGKCPDAPSGLPMTEMHIRAMPDSHRYILTAAPHHGESFGSLCALDLRVPDDGHMSQLRRITPYAPFPESESAGRIQYQYGTAWPVSGDVFLCNRWEDLVVLDRFGNEELVCERELLPAGYDPRLRLTHPKPLRSRPKPPVIPQQTAQGEAFAKADQRSTIGLVNVRVTDQPFPEGRTPARLRVLQVIPKDGPWMDSPMIGYATENTPRIPLGTVPLEADGSAYFEAPAGKQLIFQVLDENSMAIQTMRSTAFVHPGERLTCLGCHEPKNESYGVKGEQPLAFRKKPARLEPECGPVEPVSFHRQVEPILKGRCLACHQKEGKGPQAVDFESLREYVFRFSGGMFGSTVKKEYGGSRSIPGRCGAAASRLGRALLTPAHRKAVPEEERHRIVLWLDANAPRYGAFHDTAAQERGELVWPLLDVHPANPLANVE